MFYTSALLLRAFLVKASVVSDGLSRLYRVDAEKGDSGRHARKAAITWVAQRALWSAQLADRGLATGGRTRWRAMTTLALVHS